MLAILLFERNSLFSRMTQSKYWKVITQFALLNGLYTNICILQFEAV